MTFGTCYEGEGGTGGSLGDANSAATALLAVATAVADERLECITASEASMLFEEMEVARADELAAEGYVKQAEARLKSFTPHQEQMLMQERDSLRAALQASQKHFARTCEAGLDASRAATSNVRRIVQELSMECRKSQKSTECHEERQEVLRCEVAQAAALTEKLSEERDALKSKAMRAQEADAEKEEAEKALVIAARISACEAETHELQLEIKAEQDGLQVELAAEHAALEGYMECATSAQALHRKAMAAELRHRIVRRESEEANKLIEECQTRLSEEASRHELQTIRQQRSEGHLQALAGEASRHRGAARRLAFWAAATVIFLEMCFRIAEAFGL